MSVSGATLSVKERLALLQDSNAGKNKDLAGPMKTTSRPSPATKPPEISTTQPKPVLPILKPVKPPATDSGGAANQDGSDAIPKWRKKDITPVKPLASDADVTSCATPSSSEEPVHDKSTARLSIKERLEALNKSSGSKDGLPPMSSVNSAQKAVFPKPQQNESLTSPVSPKGDNAESRSAKWPPVPTKKIGEHPVIVPPQNIPKEERKESVSSLSPSRKKSDNEEQQAIRVGHTNLLDRGLKPLKPPPGKIKVSFLQNENDEAEDSKGGSTNLPKPLKLPGVKPIINGTVAAELTKVQLRKASGARQSSELIVRHTDGKKFRKINSASSNILPAPKKPRRLDNISLTNFVQEYQEEVEKMKKDLMSEQTGEEETDEVYDDAQSTDVVVRQSGGTVRQGAARVSAIPEFTEEEEEHEFYDDCSSKPAEPEENYDDFSEGPQEEYEAVDEINKPMSPPPSDSKKTKKENKEKEKDNEMQQNKEKATNKDNLSKKEKEQKKKEEERRKIMAKFGIKDIDQKIGDGVVLKDSGGGAFRKDLAVSKGEIVTILKMTDTPAGKWLVQNANGKIGLVQASNIEVATPTIRTVMLKYILDVSRTSIDIEQMHMVGNGRFTAMMTGSKDEKSSAKKLPEADDNEPGEVYEALPEEEGELEDIYEEL